ncbi:MAG: flavodoxin family protein [Chloroflexi bacterium CG_4_9_14_3_um_filter_45_9]|nr:MAG: flavodoxin family protein [Chloroflexi bacterium CG_4_9_14_3_um_filter_45_9]
MKVMGIVCSPRPGGNTETLVREALAGAKEAGSDVELVSLAGKSIAPCDACRACVNTGECHIKDDMQEIYKKLQESDGVVIGTPVYFANVSAQAKLIIDRTYALLWSRKLMGKVGGVVTVARRIGGGNVLSSLYAFFTTQRMLTAGGTVGYEGEAAPYGEKGAVRGDERAMREARAVGRNVVLLIGRITK